MRNRRPHLLILVAALGIVAGAGAGQSDDRTFRSDFWGFRLRVPVGWKVQEKSDPVTGIVLNLYDPESEGRVGARIHVSFPARARTPEALRGEKLKGIDGKARYAESRAIDGRIGGRDAPGLETVYTGPGDRRFRVRLHFLVGHGTQFLMQCHAPVDAFPEHRGRFERVWQSVRWFTPPAALARERRLGGLAARLAGEVLWATSWEDAAAKARAEGRAIFVYARNHSSFKLTDPLWTGVMLDPDLVALLRERFVVFRYAPGIAAPFVSPRVYGLSRTTFGTAVMITSADGRVLDETFSIEPLFVYGFLTAFLSRHPGFPGPKRDVPQDEFGRAKWRLRRGDLDRAEVLLRTVRRGEVPRVAAQLHRMRHDGRAALAALADARSEAAPREAPDLEMDEAVIRLRLGEATRARQILRRIVARHGSHARAPEAHYWLGALALGGGDKPEAEARWRHLVNHHEDSPWAWRAAAQLRSTLFQLGISGRLTWPAAEILKAVERPVPASVAASRASRARRGARDFLLATQRANGSWIRPTEVDRPSRFRPHPFDFAVTSLCAHALVSHRVEPGVEAAIARALAHLLREHERSRRLPAIVHYMDYRVWSHATMLGFFAAWLPHADSEAAIRVRVAMKRLILGLVSLERRGGGFSYFVTADLQRATQPTDQAISFVTAAVAHALHDARDAGVSVPKPLLRSTLDCLARMKTVDDTFAYGRNASARTAPTTAAAGAAGRGPLCAHALLRGGRAAPDLIRRTLEIFRLHRTDLGAQRRKSLMHTGPAGQGSHYLMFDYATAAAAVTRLPPNDRVKFRNALLEEILACRLVDGSFLDNPMLGRAYGAAMALLAFEDLGVPRLREL